VRPLIVPTRLVEHAHRVLWASSGACAKTEIAIIGGSWDVNMVRPNVIGLYFP
jgi:hypothetical protein